MSEQSTTPDLVELTRALFDAAQRQDFETITSLLAPDAAFESVALALSLSGARTIGGFLEEWMGVFEDYSVELEEGLDLSHGVVFAAARSTARLPGSDALIRQREAYVFTFVDGLIARAVGYLDIDDARAAANLLAESRA
jgi:ketosteroid isomerase-like protein